MFKTGSTVSGVPFGYRHKQGRRIVGTLVKVSRDKSGTLVAVIVDADKCRVSCDASTLKRPRKVRSHDYRFGRCFDSHVVLESGQGDRDRKDV